jgi:hypothetical protein
MMDLYTTWLAYIKLVDTGFSEADTLERMKIISEVTQSTLDFFTIVGLREFHENYIELMKEHNDEARGVGNKGN